MRIPAPVQVPSPHTHRMTHFTMLADMTEDVERKPMVTDYFI
jgi:hypothetical protein